MRKVCIVTVLCVLSVFLCAYTYAPSKDIKYFTIHVNAQKIVVTDRVLSPKWFNTDSHTDFTKGQTIYQRAEVARDLKKCFPEIYKILTKIKRDVEREVFHGDVHFDPSRADKFWVTGARNGIAVDIVAAESEILAALRAKKHADIVITPREVLHKTEKEVLAGIGLRAEFATKFDSGNVNRSENIARSVACFNGLVMREGEVLSFNKTVGPRTAVRGYEEAKIIIDGEFVPGVGGGVCQTSTTLFNAALLSGLTVAESHNHSLPISYVQLGRDAMVSSAVDLRLANKTGAPVYLETGIREGNRVFVKVYGDKLSGKSFKPKTEVTRSHQEVEFVGSSPAAADMQNFRKVVLEAGFPARSVRTYLESYNGGKLVSRKLVRKSNYKGQPQVIKYEPIPEPIALTTQTEPDIL